MPLLLLWALVAVVNLVNMYCTQMTKLTGELRVNEADSSGLTPLYFAVVSKKVHDFQLTYWQNILSGLSPLQQRAAVQQWCCDRLRCIRKS